MSCLPHWSLDHWKFALDAAAFIGGGIAALIALWQWRRGQAWQRAERLDRFVEQFESDELLRLATTTIDWTSRKVPFRDGTFHVRNVNALLALQDHDSIQHPFAFSKNQATLRDAYDTLLSFFARLELGISHGLIDAAAAKQYFRYWLKHFLAFDRHPTSTSLPADWSAFVREEYFAGNPSVNAPVAADLELLKAAVANESAPALVAKYISAYGDPASINRLCRHFGLPQQFTD